MTMRVPHIIPVIALGAVLAVVGTTWLSNVGALQERSDRSVAVMSGDGRLEFTTSRGEVVATALGDNCKQRVSASLGRRCEVYFEPGDEVLLHYDTANPQHVWRGATPGGLGPTITLYAGITTLTAGVILLWWAVGMPRRLRALLLPLGRLAGRDGSHRADG